ncbi:9684_t:CDS:2 [Scutellospora calospora]|uniref:9684_t:CDS:1 n=1 Tax=Scutellospora calospora TaxID=85575 RepID=A0ACA9JV68_9GLOM|nr:9684_t:CDS:2 [Scutellospora calospora]
MNVLRSLYESYKNNANESINTIQEEPEDITIIIHVGDTEEGHDSGNIMPNMSLSEVRNLLKHNKQICMGDNMKFLKIKNNIQLQISSDEEECKVVSKILDKNNCIHILKDPTKPSFFQFINKHHLMRGRYFTSDSMEVKIAQQDAFKFKQNCKIFSELEVSNNKHTLYSETCKEEIEQIFVRHLISKANASVPLAPYSFKFGVNFENFRNKKQQVSDSYEFKGVKCVKCNITIFRDQIEPTDEFKDAISKALEQETDELRLDEINKLSEKFGDFFPLETDFGGIIQFQTDYSSKTSINSKRRQFESNIQGSSLTYNSESNLSTSKYYTNKNYVIIGGDTHECKDINIEDIGNQKDWLKSLSDYNKWGLINYSKIVSVYELLDDELRMKFLRIFGQKVLYYKTIEVDFNEKNITEPQKRPITIPTDILRNMKENKQDYQIYATVLHNVDEVFSVHIEYFSPTNPYLVILCVKEKKSSKILSFNKKYKITVAWMIVGFHLNFNFKHSLFKLKSYTLTNPMQKFYNDPELNDSNEYTDESFSEIFKSHNSRTYCLLGTCVFRHQDDENEEIATRIVAGCHFCKNDNRSWKPCFYAFDLVIDICQKNKLEIHCGIITENSHTLIGPEEVKWDECKNRNSHTIYKGKEWEKSAKEGEQELIFASLLYEKHNCEQCSPVFINVNPKHPIMLSFKKQDMKGQISYLVADFF